MVRLVDPDQHDHPQPGGHNRTQEHRQPEGSGVVMESSQTSQNATNPTPLEEGDDGQEPNGPPQPNRKVWIYFLGRCSDHRLVPGDFGGSGSIPNPVVELLGLPTKQSAPQEDPNPVENQHAQEPPPRSFHGDEITLQFGLEELRMTNSNFRIW